MHSSGGESEIDMMEDRMFPPNILNQSAGIMNLSLLLKKELRKFFLLLNIILP